MEANETTTQVDNCKASDLNHLLRKLLERMGKNDICLQYTLTPSSRRSWFVQYLATQNKKGRDNTDEPTLT